MKFRYKKYGPGIVRPVIPVDLSFGERAVSYEALIDSGADLCIFPAEIGELLGIQVERGRSETVAGITGHAEIDY